MKHQLKALFLGLTVGLATSSHGYAMSDLVSITIAPEWPTSSTPGNVVLYRLSAVTREGSGLLEVSLSSLGLPAGATASFAPASLRFTGKEPLSQSAILTITCDTLTAMDTLPFAVTAIAPRDAVTLTNQVQPLLYAAATRPVLLGVDWLGAGMLKVRGEGLPGNTYQIERTPDLQHPTWSPAGTATADGNGRFSLLTTQLQNALIGFYRLVSPASASTPTP